MAITVSILQKKFLRSVNPKQPKISNFHFDLSLKLSQGEVQDFSGELQKFSGEVRISPQNPAMFDKYS
jgi:polyisoprenoid-binding protein YceI